MAITMKRTTLHRLAAVAVVASSAIAVAAIAVANRQTSVEATIDAADLVLADRPGMTVVRVIGPDGELTGPVVAPRLELSDLEWQARLSPAQYIILRGKGTEDPFCGTLLDNKLNGVYACAGCKLPLFDSKAKFDSGTGWPSFSKPIAKENVVERRDTDFEPVQVEVLCARCDGHLGHLFDDGPWTTGLRYCINSESLVFEERANLKNLAETIPRQDAAEAGPGHHLPAPAKDFVLTGESALAKAVLAGGCFWCTEAVFEEIDGVVDVVSGYTGGSEDTADYDSVLTGGTGHAEAIEIVYDTSKITFGELLRFHFSTHDPTTEDRQGGDKGPQYRSAIFYADEKEKAVAEAYIAQLTEAKSFYMPIVTTLEPLTVFYPAERYHQNYAKWNKRKSYVVEVIMPKVEKVREIAGAASSPVPGSPGG